MIFDWYMKRILVIGDTHIRERADEIPDVFMRFFRERRYDYIIHTGDLVDPEVIDVLKTISPGIYVVEGNMDYLDLPDHLVLNEEGVRIGVAHGHQVRPRGNIERLTKLARELGASILISGHTHTPFIEEYEGILHINPGSATGVWGGGGGSMTPSFIEIEFTDDKRMIIYLYELEKERIMLKTVKEIFLS